MILMDMTLRNYLTANLITGEEAYMFAQDKSMFEQFFLKEGTGEMRAMQAEADKHAKKQAPAKK